MTAQTGSLKVDSQNIFPIIKKFLYSDQEIFLRELVSNAVDATQKLRTLMASENLEKDDDLAIEVKVDKAEKTIQIIDKGVGMTAEEVDKYINQIAFSGAEEFVNKFKDVKDAKQIIGHFGLGFYSSFMVAEKVTIDTLSYQKDASAAFWSCEGDTTFQMEASEKKDRGTTITLHISEEGEEYLEENKIKELLEKYCSFMPVEIKFKDEVINDPNPIWTKAPADLKDEDYKNFYEKLYPFAQPPLFWIHLNVDYPFNLTGILYFPKLTNQVEIQKNKIQLYSNQVFVTDSVENIVPEFLTLLHGVLDSPDIPLNVSRSYLQADSNVKKISNHIVKKVADKLSDLFKKERATYEEKWADINVFVKYGMLTNDKFKDKAKSFALLTDTEGKHYTAQEYLDQIAPNQTDKDGNKVVLYAQNEDEQDASIQNVKQKGYSVLKLGEVIDSHFVQLLEREFEKVSVKRVDADTPDQIIDKDEKNVSLLDEKEETRIAEIYQELLDKKKEEVEVRPLASDDMPMVITQNEMMRRMKEMSAVSGEGFGAMPDMHKITINANHPLAKKVLETEDGDARKQMVQQVYDLTRLSNNMLKGKDLTDFVKRSIQISV